MLCGKFAKSQNESPQFEPSPTHRRSVDRDGRLGLAGHDVDGQELRDALLQLQLVGSPALGQPIRPGLLIRQDGWRIEVGIWTGVRRTASGGRVDVEPLGRLDDEGDVDGDGEEEDEKQEELSELEDRFPLPGKTGSPPNRIN